MSLVRNISVLSYFRLLKQTSAPFDSGSICLLTLVACHPQAPTGPNPNNNTAKTLAFGAKRASTGDPAQDSADGDGRVRGGAESLAELARLDRAAEL